MRRVVLACALLCLAALCSSLRAQTKNTETIPLDQIRPGMQGVAYTVFEGTKPEPMKLEVRFAKISVQFQGLVKFLNGGFVIACCRVAFPRQEVRSRQLRVHRQGNLQVRQSLLEVPLLHQ